ncbi:MAG: adenylosuccinate lyase, partial [Campylobacteraceae bacterium]|nr:adenylosuccinate lyase [Campylobacteraceae bacterium]
MVERYARDEMKNKWSIQAKYDAWLKVEKAVVKGWNKLGLVNDDECQ